MGRTACIEPQSLYSIAILLLPPVGRTACTEPQCLYSRAIPLLPLWTVRPVQSLSACRRVHFTFYLIASNVGEGVNLREKKGTCSEEFWQYLKVYFWAGWRNLEKVKQSHKLDFLDWQYSIPMFLNRRAAARYRALASIIPAARGSAGICRFSFLSNFMNKCFIVEIFWGEKIFVNVSKNSDPDVGLRKLQYATIFH